MDDITKTEVQKMIEEAINKAMSFSTRKRGDTPTENNQLTPKGYVTSVIAAIPAGNNTEVQFKNGSVFGSSSNFTYDSATNGGGFSIIGPNATSNGTGANGSMYAGNGNGSGAGGVLDIESGSGGATGAGGLLSIIAGLGGATSGNGGNLDLESGSAQGGNSNGGDLIVKPGAGTGTGHAGDTKINNGSAISTSANGGFLVIPKCAGAPTGTPTLSGSLVYDTTNNKLYVYNGAWKSITLA